MATSRARQAGSRSGPAGIFAVLGTQTLVTLEVAVVATALNAVSFSPEDLAELGQIVASDRVALGYLRPGESVMNWFIDSRYLVRIGEDRHWVYSLLIIEGYSRKILAGMATEHQDVVAVLQLLNAAALEYGRPEGSVSDNGSAFTSEAYEGLLRTLGSEVCHIEKGKPWQNLIEAQFKVELRLADAHFEQATTLEEIQERHAAFVELFNTTPHWAHRHREDGLRTPVDVLSWVRDTAVDQQVLQRALRHVQLERVVTLRGYVSVQRFYLYPERGLSRKRVSVWLREGQLQIACHDAILAQYAYRCDRKARQLRAADSPELFSTVHRSPQLEFWELDDEQWHKIAPRPYEQRAIPIGGGLRQLVLLAVGGQEARQRGAKH